MFPYKRKIILIGLVVWFAGFLSACRSSPPLATQLAPGISVGITGDNCPNVVVQVGGQVTWTNQDNREHIVRDNPAEGKGQFDSGGLQPGDVFTFTFTQPGDYSYACSADDAMTGTIRVEP
jgi:plastocyanin